MRLNKSIYITCALTTACTLFSYTTGSNPLFIKTASSQPVPLIPSQTLWNALNIIGVPGTDMDTLKTTGQATPTTLSLFTKYAENSGNSAYDQLSQDESNALILFGFKLKNQNQITDNVLNDLMVAEKKELGMSTANIKTLRSLALSLEDSPSYALTLSDVTFVRQIIPFIQENPFAFADVLGLLIRAFLVQEDSDSPIDPSIDDEIESALTDAAQTLSGLTDDQIVNITNITQNYETTEQFNDSDSNVEDLSAAMAVAAVPFGLFALYPLIGSEAVYGVGDITRNYEGSFNRGYVDRYNGEIDRNRDNFPRNDVNNARARTDGNGLNNRSNPAERGQRDLGGNNNARGDLGQNSDRSRSLDRSRMQAGNGGRANGARAGASNQRRDGGGARSNGSRGGRSGGGRSGGGGRR